MPWNPFLTQSSWKRHQEPLKILIYSSSGIANFPKKITLKPKAEKLEALIDAVKCINNGEVGVPEDSEDLDESEKESSGADGDGDGEDPDLNLKINCLYQRLFLLVCTFRNFFRIYCKVVEVSN